MQKRPKDLSNLLDSKFAFLYNDFIFFILQVYTKISKHYFDLGKKITLIVGPDYRCTF